jgi:integrase
MKLEHINEINVPTFFINVIANRKAMGLSCFNYSNALQHLICFGGKEIPFPSVTPEWIESLRQYLLIATGFKCNKQLSANSANTYYRIILNVLKHAYELRLIDSSVLKELKSIERPPRKSESLSEEELKRLAESKCDSPSVKQAFLLSALTGLRWNEIVSLRWSHVEDRDDHSYQLSLKEFKARRTIPLSSQAYAILGRPNTPDTLIFAGMKWNTYLYIMLNKWAIHAGILRNITFQSARTTFATLLKDQGIPVEIISELLGHTALRSTLSLINSSLSSTETFNT